MEFNLFGIQLIIRRRPDEDDVPMDRYEIRLPRLVTSVAQMIDDAYGTMHGTWVVPDVGVFHRDHLTGEVQVRNDEMTEAFIAGMQRAHLDHTEPEPEPEPTPEPKNTMEM